MEQNTKIYLYVKESPLGLKYLGQTIQNPYTYRGSGVFWRKHLKENSFSRLSIKTTILLETTDLKELASEALRYSKEFDIVNSPDWANIQMEKRKGTMGFKHTEEARRKISERQTGRKHSQTSIQKMKDIYWLRPEDQREGMVPALKYDEEWKEKVRKGIENKKQEKQLPLNCEPHYRKAVINSAQTKWDIKNNRAVPELGYLILDETTGIYYKSKMELVESLNIGETTFRDRLKRGMYKNRFLILNTPIPKYF